MVNARPQAQPEPEFRQPNPSFLQRQGLVAAARQPEDLQLMGVAAERDVIRHAQNFFVHLPLARRLIDIARRAPQIFLFGAGGKQLDHDEWIDPFLPHHVAQAQIPAFVQFGYP